MKLTVLFFLISFVISAQDRQALLLNKTWVIEDLKTFEIADPASTPKPADQMMIKRKKGMIESEYAYIFLDNHVLIASTTGRTDTVYWDADQNLSFFEMGNDAQDTWKLKFDIYSLNDDHLILHYKNSIGLHDYFYFKANVPRLSFEDSFKKTVKYGVRWIYDYANYEEVNMLKSKCDDPDLALEMGLHEINFFSKSDSLETVYLSPYKRRKGVYTLEDQVLHISYDNGEKDIIQIMSFSRSNLEIEVSNSFCFEEKLKINYFSDRGETVERYDWRDLNKSLFYKSFLTVNTWKDKSQSKSRYEFDKNMRLKSNFNKASRQGYWELDYNILYLYHHSMPAQAYKIDTLSHNYARLLSVNNGQKVVKELIGNDRRYDVKYNESFYGTWEIEDYEFLYPASSFKSKTADLREIVRHLVNDMKGDLSLELNTDNTYVLGKINDTDHAGTWKVSKEKKHLFLTEQYVRQDYIFEIQLKDNKLYVLMPDFQSKEELMGWFVFKRKA